MDASKKCTFKGTDEKSIRVTMIVCILFSLISFAIAAYFNLDYFTYTGKATVAIVLNIIIMVILLIIASKGNIEFKLIRVPQIYFILTGIFNVVSEVVKLMDMISIHRKDLADDTYSLSNQEYYIENSMRNIILLVIILVIYILCFTVAKRRILLATLGVFISGAILLMVFGLTQTDMFIYTYYSPEYEYYYIHVSYALYECYSLFYGIAMYLFFLWVIVKKYRMLGPSKRELRKASMAAENVHITTPAPVAEMEYKFCSSCGARSNKDAKFCNGCGSRFIL